MRLIAAALQGDSTTKKDGRRANKGLKEVDNRMNCQLCFSDFHLSASLG